MPLFVLMKANAGSKADAINASARRRPIFLLCIPTIQRYPLLT
ncbi:hypothetical protein Cabys_2450 [Caldithrix abyssi DSM 13497]|uniref:Uncharacterized protein n=1 Tax=Caldithrix abyssi DSM 13497 TaxID=880073 RepID=A0A1J1C971_CALAY|nr:hypothetical protein Cabys_2450 [Caldithrix abyssi DSM 13497]